MRILREWGIGLGALVAVIGLVLQSVAPERRVWTLSITGFGLLLFVAGVVLNAKGIGAALRGRRARAASASVGYTLTVLAVVVLVNFLAARHTFFRKDLTENRDFSLSEQTEKILEGLPREVSLTSFSREGDPGRQKLQDLLEEYTHRSRRLTVRYVDPDKNPAEVRRYNVTELGTLVIESGKQEQRVTAGDEESITNAIIKVTTDRERIVYGTTGHGEHDLNDTDRGGLSALKSALEKQNYVVKPLTLNAGVPADASVVIIDGPAKPFLEAETKMISDWVEKGGRLLLAQDPGVDPGFDALLASFGAAVRKDVVIDKVSQLFGGDARIPMVPADGYDRSHPITKTFDYQTIYPLASSIDVKEPSPPGVTAVKLARTSEMSWGEVNEEEFRTGRIQLDDRDTRGPITLVAAFEKKGSAAAPDPAPAANTDAAKPPAAPGARLVLFGDGDFASNNYFNAGGNGDLALNAVAWLVEQGELMSIRPKSGSPRIAILSPAQVFYYFWTIVAIAPIMIATVGVGIWWRRKRL
ncbi:MAG TPA: GldG family protein [Candidatus Binatia bacterium]|nr:GldG family protein [Candidatus Binatia bacterium]